MSEYVRYKKLSWLILHFQLYVIRSDRHDPAIFSRK